jgi:glycosyltransferase involved in cell wall biosynthesis
MVPGKTRLKQVLYISYDGMTDPLGQSQVLPYLTALSTHGYKITLLSFEKVDRFEKERAIVEKIAQSAGITWKPLLFTRRPPVLAKIYDRWKLKQAVKKLAAHQAFDMVHCRSYVAAEMGLWMKKHYGSRFLFDMRGFWADEKLDSGQWSLQNPLYRRAYFHFKKKEKEFLLQADAIVSLTVAAQKELQKNAEYKNLKIDVIPCCADLDHFDYNKINKEKVDHLRDSLGISRDARVISYLGSVGGWYMTREMFEFYNRLLLKYPDFRLLILTKDPPDKVRQQAAAYGISPGNIAVKYSSRQELPDHIAMSNCSIFFIRPTYSKIASSPTKHAELMGMGIPVICNNIGDTGHVINETQTGQVIYEFNNKEYDRVIGKMDEFLAIPKEKIRRAAFTWFDLEKGVEQYLYIYKKLTGDNHA